VIRGGLLVLIAAVSAAWITYVHVWRYGEVRALDYRLATLRHFEPAHPLVRVTTDGTQERVLITAGPRSTTGYSLEVRHAVVEHGRISITVRERAKPGRAEVTYPYLLLVFPKLDKPVHVHWEGRT
jgi:hypothetical protein